MINAALAASSYVAGRNGATYLIKSPVTIPAGATLDLTGCTVNAQVSVADPNTGNKSAFVFGRGGKLALIGGKIDGKSITAVGLDLSGFDDGQVQNITVKNVDVTGCTVAGLQIQGGYRSMFDNLHLHGNGVGILVSATTFLSSLGQFDFRGCWIETNTNEGVKVLGSGGLFNFFGGNVEHNGNYGFNFNPPVAGFFTANLLGVDIEQNGNYTSGIGVRLQANTSGVNVIGCQFVGNAANAAQWKSWQIDSGANRNTFTNNLVQGHAVKATDAGSANTIFANYGLSGDGTSENYLTMFATASGAGYVELLPEGGDTNVQIRLTPKGTQSINLNGPVLAGSLPTADPHVVGQLWRNAGVVTVSAG